MFQLLNTAHVQNLPPLLALRFRARDFCSFAASVTPTFKLSPSLRMWTMLSLICTFTPTPKFALPPTPTPKIEKKADEEMPSVLRLRAFPYIYIQAHRYQQFKDGARCSPRCPCPRPPLPWCSRSRFPPPRHQSAPIAARETRARTQTGWTRKPLHNCAHAA